MMKKLPAQVEEIYGIKILRNGTWLHNGSPIDRHNLVKLFSTVLQRDADGGYWLVTPVEKGRIEVEDAPFTAVELRVSSSGKSQQLDFRTNLDDWVGVGPMHPLRVAHDAVTGEPSPYVIVRGGMEALVVRSVYYELARLAVPEDGDTGIWGVWSREEFYPIGKLDE